METRASKRGKSVVAEAKSLNDPAGDAESHT